LIEASQILIASGAVPNLELANSLEGQGYDVHVIGDSNEVGYLEGAMLSGARLGHTL